MNIAYIQVTRNCNQSCVFCSNPSRNATLELRDIKKMLRKLSDMNYGGVILTGGEPTVHPELDKIISATRKTGLDARIITNGQITAEKGYLERLVRAGLSSMSLSIYSHRKDVHEYLSGVHGSFCNVCKTLEIAEAIGLPVSISTVINVRNADHLHLVVEWITGKFPFVRHFVWNNLDPFNDRVSTNPEIIPSLRQFETSLFSAMSFLQEHGFTFRVERVPLCRMAEFAHCSTETRKIVKEEERMVYFLDEKGQVRQSEFNYGKIECCASCMLNEICAGLFAMDESYDSGELYPVFLNSEDVVKKILTRETGS